MRVKNGHDSTELDRMAYRKAAAIAESNGLRDRAASTFTRMADELISELGPVIETQARTEADQAAKERLRGILSLPEAEGRRDLAEQLALETESSVDQIASMLSSTPKKHDIPDPLATLMRGNSPGISSDDGDADAMAADEGVERAAQHILTAGGAYAQRD